MPMLWHPRQHLGTSWGGGAKVLAPQVILAMELINSIRIIFSSHAPLSEGAGGSPATLAPPPAQVAGVCRACRRGRRRNRPQRSSIRVHNCWRALGTTPARWVDVQERPLRILENAQVPPAGAK